MKYYIYMLRCTDGTLYTGSCVHLQKRMREHTEHLPACARYTRSREIAELAGLWCTEGGRSAAYKLEWYLKHRTRQQKEEILSAPSSVSAAFPGADYTPVPGATLAGCLNGSVREIS